MAQASQRQFLVSVLGIEDYFATFSGGEISADVGKVWNGGRLRPDTLSAPAETDNITVGRPYDPERDQPVISALEQKVGRWKTTITKQPTDADFTVVGKATTYPDCVLARVAAPEADAASGDGAMFEIEFTTNGPAAD